MTRPDVVIHHATNVAVASGDKALAAIDAAGIVRTARFSGWEVPLDDVQLADRTAVTSKCASKVPVSSVSETSEVQVMRSVVGVLAPAQVLNSLNGLGVPPVGVNVASMENVTAWSLVSSIQPLRPAVTIKVSPTHALIPRPNDALVISKRPIRIGHLLPHADLNVGRVAFGKGGQRRPASGSCTAGRS